MRSIILVLFVALLSLPTISQTNVLGGEKANRGDYPWMAQLRALSQPRCAGVLIAPGWILTAAHCGVEIPPSIPAPDHVYVNLFTYPAPNIDAEYLSIDTIFTHEDFSVFNPNAGPDIALIRLETPSAYDPVPLAAPGDTSLYTTGAAARVLGWGATDSMGNLSDTLKQADITIIDFDTCNAAYQNTVIGQLQPFMVCAGFTMGMTPAGAGSGDSGGPLLASENGQWKHIGIVSAGNGVVTSEEHPGIFTKTISQRAWIDSVMAANAQPAGLSKDNALKNSISVHPGPGRLTVSYEGAVPEEAAIYIYDATGALQHHTTVTLDGRMDIPLPERSQGIYFVNIQTRQSRMVEKFYWQ